MADFEHSLQEAEKEMFAQVDGAAARRRVAQRLRSPAKRSRFESSRMRTPALAFALAGACLAVGYWLGHSSEEPSAEVDPPTVVAEQNTPRAPQLGGGLPDPVAREPSAATMFPTTKTGQLLAEQVGGTCEFLVGTTSFGVKAELDVPLPVGHHDVICRRGLQVQHQRLEIASGSTTRVVFRFAHNTVDQAHDPSGLTVKGTRGTLVAIAIGGSCKFTVDGKTVGFKSSVRLKVAIGPHEVGCERKSGKRMLKTVEVKTDRPGIASFRIGSDDDTTTTPPAPPAPPAQPPPPAPNRHPDLVDPFRHH